jgi:hypothetical protein
MKSINHENHSSRQDSRWKSMSALAANIVVPFVGYQLLTHCGLSQVAALVWVSCIPGTRLVIDWVRTRRIDLVSCVVLWEILLTLVVAGAFHSARLLLLKGPIQVAALGMACLISVCLKLPIGQIAARFIRGRSMHIGGASIEHLGNAHADRLRLVTLVWGVVSMADAVVRAAMIFALSPGTYMLISRALQAAYLGLLGAWTLRYLRHRNDANPGR